MTRPKVHGTAEKEARLQEAIAAYQKRGKKSKGSLNRIAQDFNVPRQTLKDRLDGRTRARNKAQEEPMHLTNDEEKELANRITTLTQRGYAPRYKTTRQNPALRAGDELRF